MPKGLPNDLGKWMAQVEKRLDNLSSGNRLDHASLDGTTLYLKGDGELGRIGRQPDGSNGVHIAKVQPPPQLTAPILTVGEQAGTCLVEWDGGTFDGRRMPLIHGHTEIWAELVGDEWEPTVAPSDSGKRVGTIRDRTGGEVVVALPQAGTWAVWLRAMGADRETAGPWSPVSQVDIKPLVDTDAIEAELEDARDRLAQAEQDLASGMADRVAEIEYLRETRIPALQDALNTGLEDVYRDAQAYAEAQADDAVNRAAADAQSEYDRLQEIAERALSRAGDNVLEDPSFETDYWFDHLSGGFGGRTFTPTNDARSGDQAMLIDGGTGNWNILLQTADVEPGDSWRFAIWYKRASSAGAIQIRIREMDSGTYVDTAPDLPVISEYRRETLTYTVPESGVTQIGFYIYHSGFAGEFIVDDISAREVGAAAEALRMAEVARQEAEAAHIAAGNAVDAAANAYDAASSKNSIHWSLSAPSGTADNTDDVWWQYELRNGRRVVIGQWFWDNGVWRETEIAEEWLPLVNIGTGTYGDLSGDRLEANTVKAGALAVMPDGRDLAPDLVDYADLWTMGSQVTISSSNASESGLALRIAGDASTVSGRVYGPWIPVRAGDTIYYKLNLGWYSRTPDGDLRIYVMYNGSVTSWSRLRRATSTGTYEGHYTIPRDGTTKVAFGVNVDSPAANGGDWSVRDFDVRVAAKGVHITPQGIKSPQVDTEEFFAAQAVIDKVWTDIVRSRLVESEGIITEDMIATGAITTPKLTVTEEMVAQIASFIRVEAGSLASNDIEAMRIVSSLIEATTYLIHNADGDVSVRLDGMDNYLAGRIHAGMDEGRGISLDYRLTEVPGGWDEDSEGEGDSHFEVSPEIRFHTSHNHEYEPRIWVSQDGSLDMNPGRLVGSSSGSAELRIWGRARAHLMTSSRYDVSTEASHRSGIARDGDRMRIHGRAPDWSVPTSMYTAGSMGSYSPSSGQYRGGQVWSQPPVTGLRFPQATGRMSSASMDAWRYAIATVQVADASGFGFTLNASHGGYNMWLDYNAIWR